jgi:glyoxylase-like metal-dependent hydrolase (beta-lactamase superfamily II)
VTVVPQWQTRCPPPKAPRRSANGESPVSAGFFFYEDALRGVARVERIDFAGAAAIPPLGPSVDVFGDGSLWAISTPGHSKGHISYLIVTKAGPVLLTGDASHTRWGFEHGVPPGKTNEDAAGARRSLAQLALFANEYPEVKIVFGHRRARTARRRFRSNLGTVESFGSGGSMLLANDEARCPPVDGGTSADTCSGPKDSSVVD